MQGHMPDLYGRAKLVLFVTSYTPLFVLLIINQFAKGHDGDFAWIITIGLSLVILLGLLGACLLFRNFNRNSKNGNNVKLLNVQNRNSESIGYVATYIIPFMFQDLKNGYEVFSFLFLFFIIYRVYVNSTLLLVNPVLSLKYSIFEIEYELGGKTFSGMIISKSASLEEGSTIKINSIGFKLFFTAD